MPRVLFDGYIDRENPNDGSAAVWDDEAGNDDWDISEDDYVWMYVTGQEVSSSIKAQAGRGASGFAELFARGQYPAKWSAKRCHRLTPREEPVTFPALVDQETARACLLEFLGGDRKDELDALKKGRCIL